MNNKTQFYKTKIALAVALSLGLAGEQENHHLDEEKSENPDW